MLYEDIHLAKNAALLASSAKLFALLKPSLLKPRNERMVAEEQLVTILT